MQAVETNAVTGDVTVRDLLPYEIAALGIRTPEQELVEWRETATVSRFQAMAALLDAGLLADVQGTLAKAGVLAQLAWAEAAEFRRNSPMMLLLAAGFGLTDAQLDDLFRAAMKIEV